MENKQIIPVAALLVGDIGNVNVGMEERKEVSVSLWGLSRFSVCERERERSERLMITIRY